MPIIYNKLFYQLVDLKMKKKESRNNSVNYGKIS